MAVYVMSDLHGNYDGFMSIFKQINFSENDELYVDGGRDGIKILQYMMMQPLIYYWDNKKRSLKSTSFCCYY
jgi:hypothetical protein